MDSQHLLLLKLIQESNQQKVEGRTRLQKLVFLTQEFSDCDLGEPFDFEPYDYGPFSETILHTLNEMVYSDLIEEDVKPLPKGKKYSYSLTKKGAGRVSQLEGAVENSDDIEMAVEEVLGQFESMPISRLLEYVYNKYPQYTVNSVL